MEVILVGIGGAFGSLARYQLGKMIMKKSKSAFPWGTFFINITGAFLLGVVCSLNVRDQVYCLLGDGFLGAYTTFSTFMYEGFTMFKENHKLDAVVYIVISVVLGFIGFVMGYYLIFLREIIFSYL